MSLPRPAERRPLFVFGYGSLMWRPDFPYVAQHPAWALGVNRRLCVWSAAYRGSPDRPGLVFGLDKADGDAAADARTRGVAFEVAPAHRRAVIAYLFERELIYPIYQPEMVTVEAGGGRMQALTFTVDREDPSYGGGVPRDVRVAAIASGAGRAGRARDYLANALAGLAEMGAPELELEADLAAADALGDDPSRLFRLLDKGARRRLDAVFEDRHESPAFQAWRNRLEEFDDNAAGPLGEGVSAPEQA